MKIQECNRCGMSLPFPTAFDTDARTTTGYKLACRSCSPTLDTAGHNINRYSSAVRQGKKLISDARRREVDKGFVPSDAWPRYLTAIVYALLYGPHYVEFTEARERTHKAAASTNNTFRRENAASLSRLAGSAGQYLQDGTSLFRVEPWKWNDVRHKVAKRLGLDHEATVAEVRICWPSSPEYQDPRFNDEPLAPLTSQWQIIDERLVYIPT